MATDKTSSRVGLLSRLPWSVKLGLALLSFAYGVATLTDTITDPVPNDVSAVVYFVVAAGLFTRAMRLKRQS